LWVTKNVIRSRVGRALIAISASETVAGALAISPGAGKRFAYMFSAGLAGIAGVVYAHLVGYLSPDAFSVNNSIAILVFPILGGMRTLWGPVLGAACLTLLPDQLQNFGRHQVLIYGLILLFSYKVLPRGLIGLVGGRMPMIEAGARRAASSRRIAVDRSSHPSLDKEEGGPFASSNRSTFLEAKGVTRDFGGVRALAGVDVAIARGTIHGLIGPNGSGKTTLLNVISGVHRPGQGTIAFEGRFLQRMQPHQIAGLGIARTFQHPVLFDSLTVRENVLTGAERLFRCGAVRCGLRSPAARAEEIEFVLMAEEAMGAIGLTDLSDSLPSELPFGRQRLVELARALCLKPTLIMLDEPAAGLAQADLQELSSLLKALRARGITVLIVEHHLDFLLELVDVVTVLDEGRVIYSGSPAGMSADPKVVEAYLGSAAVEEI
jgi:branched-chain amino acid transport system permease protein